MLGSTQGDKQEEEALSSHGHVALPVEGRYDICA